jgi:putative MATE family efflux protein
MPNRFPVAKRLFDLALPVVGLNLLNVLALVVDTWMCGWGPDGTVALEALGYAGQFAFLLLVAMLGVSVGSVALVARAHGARDVARVRRLVVQSTELTVLLGLAMSLAGYVLAEHLFAALGARGEILEAALSFTHPLMTGTVFSYLTILFGASLRAVGNTRIPFAVAVAANIVNFLVNRGTILGAYGMPAMGIAGAAYGTVASQIFSAIALGAVLHRGVEPKLRVPLRIARLDFGLARELVRVGAPAALDALVMNVALLSLVGMLGHGDDPSVAAHGLGLRIQSLAFVPGLSISQATAALVGQSLGARDPSNARETVRASSWMCTSLMTGIGAVVFAFAGPIVSSFGVPDGSSIAELAVSWMRLLAYGMPLVGLHLAIAGALQGAGATWTSLRVNATATVAQIVLSAVLGFGLGLGPIGVWAAFPLAYVIKVALGYSAYRQGAWARVGAAVPATVD